MATVLGLAGSAQEARQLEEALEPKRGKFQWDFAIILTVFHLAALAALFEFRWSALAVFAATWVFAQNIGIAVAYHRLLTHRGYIVPKWLEYTIAVLGTMALQGSPVYWVAVHRLHHQYTDKPGDPHSPRDGKWWSHMGWILNGSLHNNSAVLERYAPDLTKDKFYRWLNCLSLAAGDHARPAVTRLRRPAVAALGSLLSRHCRPARHLAGKLGDPHVGIAALSDSRRLAQQLVGGAADGRRGMAQQPPRTPCFSSSWNGLVRVRSQLLGYLDAWKNSAWPPKSTPNASRCASMDDGCSNLFRRTRSIPRFPENAKEPRAAAG